MTVDPVVTALTRYVTSSFEQHGATTEDAARVRVLDSLGCAFRAEGSVEVTAARRLAEGSPFDPSGSAVWATSVRVTPEVAAFANTAAIRSLDLNDSFFGAAGLHPSDMWGGVLALADSEDRSLAEAIDAGLVGYEISVTVASILPVTDYGWDHVILMGIGAVCANARLLELSPEQVASAISLYVISHVPTRQARSGRISHWKCLAAANAASLAVRACRLAQAGVHGPDLAFTGTYGFLRQVVGSDYSAGSLVEPLSALSTPRRILDTHIKVWPLAYVAQSAVWAAEQLRRRVPSFDDIAEVELHTFAKAVEFMAGSRERWNPQTRETADHSLPYVVIEMLRRGTVDEESFSPERITAAQTREALTKIHIETVPALTARYPQEFPAHLTLTLTDGTRHTIEVAGSPGYCRQPLTPDEMSAKFHRGASRALDAEVARRLEAGVRGPASVSVRELLSLTLA